MHTDHDSAYDYTFIDLSINLAMTCQLLNLIKLWPLVSRQQGLGNGGRDLFFGYDPDRMHQARNITAKREDDVDPKMLANTDLQENAQWGEDDRQNDTNDVHDSTP